MWFIGLFIGLLLGNMLVGGYGMLWGGLLGAVGGALISYFRDQSRGSSIEARIAALEAAVTELRQKSSQASGGATPAEVAPTESASAQVTPETPYVIPQLVSDEIAPVRDRPAGTGEGIAQTPARQIAPEPLFAEPVLSQPAEPSYFDRAWNWLTGGNSLVRVGVVVLFFGVGFLLKYAYEHTHVPIEVRLIGVALAAAVMLVIGWRLRERKPVYALAMQGGGVGLLYPLVPGWRTDQEPQMSVASTGPVQKLAGESAARQRIDLKKWGLWSALFAGVAVLAWMAWRLSKQMQRPDTK